MLDPPMLLLMLTHPRVTALSQAVSHLNLILPILDFFFFNNKYGN
jgi:hypothetical protein